jgi:leader peptidase (prepilin peptidase) / N-methyltransferase
MRPLDLSPSLLLVIGALIGLAGGALAARLCDWFPARFAITHVVVGSARTRRNVGVIVSGGAIGGWFAHVIVAVSSTSFESAGFYFATNLLVALALVVAAAVDLEHLILPNELTLGAAGLALATSPWRGVGLVGALLGAAVGLALTYLPFLLYKKLRGRSGMGLGDAKLALAAGVWLGAAGAIFVVFAGAVQSVLCAAILRILGIQLAMPASVTAELTALQAKADAGDGEARAALANDPMAADVGGGAPSFATMRLPMGPFLVLACLEYLIGVHAVLPVLDHILRLP